MELGNMTEFYRVNLTKVYAVNIIVIISNITVWMGKFEILTTSKRSIKTKFDITR